MAKYIHRGLTFVGMAPIPKAYPAPKKSKPPNMVGTPGEAPRRRAAVQRHRYHYSKKATRPPGEVICYVRVRGVTRAVVLTKTGEIMEW